MIKAGKRLRKPLFRFLARQSRVGDPGIFPRGSFAWTEPLEAQWREIRAELDVVLDYRKLLPPFQEISQDNSRIAKSDRWKVFMLYGFGERSERNCGQCPETARVLAGIPGLVNAWFSIMSPHYHVPPHKGITKGLIRCHLGLVIPPAGDRCRMRIGKDVFTWEEGRCVVFDDTRRHEVWNETDEERVVLLIDVERPLRPLGKLVSKGFNTLVRLSPYFRDARRNQLAWEDRFYAEIGRLRASAAAAL